MQILDPDIQKSVLALPETPTEAFAAQISHLYKENKQRESDADPVSFSFAMARPEGFEPSAA